MPRGVKGTASVALRWLMALGGHLRRTHLAVFSLAPILSGQRCTLHLPSTRESEVLHIALNGQPDTCQPQSTFLQKQLCFVWPQTPIHPHMSNYCRFWCDVMSLSFLVVCWQCLREVRACNNAWKSYRALCVDIANVDLLSPNSMIFRTGFLRQVPPVTRLCRNKSDSSI